MAASTVESNIDILETMYESFAAGDIEAATAVFDPAIEWHEPEGLEIGGTYHGPQEVKEALASLLRAFETATFVPERYVEADESVIVFGTFTGTHRGTGKSVEIPLVHVWEFQDGTAIEFRRYTDTAMLNWAFEE